QFFLQELDGCRLTLKMNLKLHRTARLKRSRPWLPLADHILSDKSSNLLVSVCDLSGDLRSVPMQLHGLRLPVHTIGESDDGFTCTLDREDNLTTDAVENLCIHMQSVGRIDPKEESDKPYYVN